MISEKIIVIDDDLRIHHAIKLSLPEYQIISFHNGADAIAYLAKPNEINIILLDLRLPGTSLQGMSILEEIRKINKEVGVILMSAYGSKDILVDALRKHADDYIEKPFAMEELKERVELILREKLHPKNLRRDKNGQVGRIKDFIERNYSSATLEFIAGQLCLSSKYVSQFFKQNNRTSFRAYKLQIKMDKAKSFLERTNLNVTEIALKLGYENPESFMRIFKRVNNMTPTEYRRQSGKRRVISKKEIQKEIGA